MGVTTRPAIVLLQASVANCVLHITIAGSAFMLIIISQLLLK
jgi:hypothetical protein